MDQIKKRRVLSYKLFKSMNAPLTLQEMLENSLSDTDSGYHLVSNREEDLSGGERTSLRFINRFFNLTDDMLLCQLVVYEKDSSQMTIHLDNTSTMYKITPVFPKDIKQEGDNEPDELKQTEFVESMMYFGVINNHVVTLSSGALKPRELEYHLEWYLKSLTQQVENPVMLSDKPTRQALKQLEEDSAKSVFVGSDICYVDEVPTQPANSESPQPGSITETKSVQLRAATMGAEILDYLKARGYLQQLDFEDTLDDANLQVNLEFKFNRKTSRNGQRVLDTLATSMRHIEKEDVKIKLLGGGEINGDDLKLTHPITVLFNERGGIEESDLYHKMKNWLKSKVQTDEVTSDLVEMAVLEE
ncbi:hypothetical protein [Vibrio sp. L85]|uniref:hypothetical protein n=1 Tax=Vibrio sp. L85 TaxID=1769292 RepID=UPI0009A3AF75|nr:hypothetical protein [Vibrio sp. L85]